jgi:hypothetical protein
MSESVTSLVVSSVSSHSTAAPKTNDDPWIDSRRSVAGPAWIESGTRATATGGGTSALAGSL